MNVTYSTIYVIGVHLKNWEGFILFGYKVVSFFNISQLYLYRGQCQGEVLQND